MPDIPPVIFEHMQQTTNALGRIEANQDTALNYIKVVHEELKRHVAERGAHGLEADRDEAEKSRKESLRVWNNAPNWIMALTSMLAILSAMYSSGILKRIIP